MMFSGFLRWSVWQKIIQNRRAGVEGNMKGEGRILGGVFVIGPGSQGIIFEHREKEFGDYADTTEVLKAVEKICKSHTGSKI
uniref:Peroxiredoxin-like 2A n=1 Tax=Arion vulgaris TaxID=1028688 RepID=A0A0B7B8W8_9EUPU